MDYPLIVNGQIVGGGSIAQRLLRNNMDQNTLRTWVGKDGRAYMNVNGKGVPITHGNATLRKDEWKDLDAAVLKLSQERLVGVQDLISRGLTYNIPNGMGKTILEYEDQGDFTAAQLDMDAVTRGKGDRPIYSLKGLPLPIIHKEFQVTARALAASRNGSTPLDTSGAEMATRMVAEKQEDLLFTGSSSFAFGSYTLYGYVDAPDRNTVTLTQNWDASGKTGAEIITDVLAMKQASINAKHYGPWVIYIPTAYETVLDNDYDTTTPGTTIRERILKIAGIEDIKVVDKLAANTVLLVQMTADVVRWVTGMPITTTDWTEQGGSLLNFKVMTISVPQIRADKDGNSGITHLAA